MKAMGEKYGGIIGCLVMKTIEHMVYLVMKAVIVYVT